MDYEQYFGGDEPPVIGGNLDVTIPHKEGEEYPQNIVGFHSEQDADR